MLIGRTFLEFLRRWANQIRLPASWWVAKESKSIPTRPAHPTAPQPPNPTKFDRSSETGIQEYEDAELQYKGALNEFNHKLSEYQDAIEIWNREFAKIRDLHETSSKSIRTILRYIFGIMLFCIITASGINDYALLTDTGKIELPIVKFSINFYAFFILSTVILIGATSYLHVFIEYKFSLPKLKDLDLPYIFDMRGSVAKTIRWAIFYAISPITLGFLAWRASPIPYVGEILFHATWLVVVAMLIVHSRHIRTDYQFWSAPLHGGMIVLIIYGVFLAHQIEPFFTRNLNLANSDLANKKLRSLNLRFARFNNADLSGVDLEGVDLTGTNLTDAILTGANLRSAILNDSTLVRTTLHGTDLTDVSFEKSSLKDIVIDDKTTLDDRWREVFDLYNKEYRQFPVRKFSGAWLQGANFFGSDLRHSDFSEADLRGANLSRAQLEGADLSLAALADADLRGVQDLEFNQLSSSCLDETTVLDEHLSSLIAKHLPPSECEHIWPPLAERLSPPSSPTPRFVAPDLGPIVGSTTGEMSRLWIRGALVDQPERAVNSRVGIAIVLHENGLPVRSPMHHAYFRLKREFDLTGTVDVGEGPGISADKEPLEFDSSYEVRIATTDLRQLLPTYGGDVTLVSGAELDRLLPSPIIWSSEVSVLDDEKTLARFRSCPTSEPGQYSQQGTDGARFTFLVGSNRYPGLLWKIKAADRIFGTMLDKVTERQGTDDPIRFVMFVGNQIYADMFNRLIPMGMADTQEEFRDRYVSALGSRNMRQLLRQVPTYMILDDHEIEDNWTQDRIKDRKKRVLFQIAINAYKSYQWSHGPRSFDNRLYYEFVCGGYPFFVLDTRTQRFMDDVRDNLDDNQMLGRSTVGSEEPSQLARLLDWLGGQQRLRPGAPKFVVSPTPIVPDFKGGKRNEGGWAMFPETRRQVLNFIANNKIQNVIFIGGKMNLSNTTEININKKYRKDNIRAYSIISSPLYWPFPFGRNPESYVQDTKKENEELAIGDDYIVNYLSQDFIETNSFARISIEPNRARVLVDFLNAHGEIIRSDELQLYKHDVTVRSAP